MLQLEGGKRKSMWEQPGGRLGMVILAGIAVGSLVILFRILPYLITLAENTLYFGILLGAIGLITFLLLDKKFRRIVSVAYFIFMRKITSLFINIDPIAIIERRLEMMEKSIKKMDESMGRLNGQIRKLEGNIKNKKEEMESLIHRAKAQHIRGKKDAALIDERQAVRLEKYINKLLGFLKDSKNWYENLDKIGQMAKFTLQDTRNEVNMQREEYEMARQQHKIFRSVMSIMDGDPDELAMFNDALEVMRNDIESKLGEIERVINSTGGMIDQFEAEKDVDRLKGNELIDRYNRLGMEGIFKTFEQSVKIDEASKTIYLSKNDYSSVTLEAKEVFPPSDNRKKISDRSYF